MQKNARWLLIAVLLVALWASAFGPLDRWINEYAMGSVAQRNSEYLEASFKDASHSFLVLTGIKTVLAVIEGSEVGVGFNLQVGDVVQAAYDYIDFAWTVMLLSTLVLIMTQMLLEAARWMDSYALTVTLCTVLLYLAVSWGCKCSESRGWRGAAAQHLRTLRHVLRDCSYLFVVFTFAAYLLLPLSVAAGAKLSAEITAIHKVESSAQISRMQSDLDAKYAAIGEADGVLQKARRIQDLVVEVGNYLATRTGVLFWHVVSLCAAYIFDVVVFPLLLFVLMFWFVRLLARYFFGLRQQRAFREDLSLLLEKHFGARGGDGSLSDNGSSGGGHLSLNPRKPQKTPPEADESASDSGRL